MLQELGLRGLRASDVTCFGSSERLGGLGPGGLAGPGLQIPHHNLALGFKSRGSNGVSTNPHHQLEDT